MEVRDVFLEIHVVSFQTFVVSIGEGKVGDEAVVEFLVGVWEGGDHAAVGGYGGGEGDCGAGGARQVLGEVEGGVYMALYGDRDEDKGDPRNLASNSSSSTYYFSVSSFSGSGYNASSSGEKEEEDEETRDTASPRHLSISFGRWVMETSRPRLIAYASRCRHHRQDDAVRMPFLSQDDWSALKGVVLTHKSLVSSVAQQVELGEKANVDMLALFFGREGGF
ncbi:hypothetical protein J5N97_001278 [Dioscorea zingiberensis]|uniref:Uncharacterized protein n=1 Tax=Dioscorea zingiberensis TaxID=325984 RepID=A0A9D5H2J6_9LILI|nr:hypothetical protein J5N97_001278 [Dioscorea zingiberensis]